MKNGINFMDITDHPFLGASIKKPAKVQFPERTQHIKAVQRFLKELSKDNMRKNLEKFTSFYTRYYKSSTGAESSAWLLGRVQDIITESNTNATVKAFPHSWGQSSIIATIPGRSNKTIVIGAHQDSANLFAPMFLPAPGADDDGSGTVTILEAFRILLSLPAVIDGSIPNTIEFHWYSAEEGGLLGSQAIFSKYESDKHDVKAMLQQDMTGYLEGTLKAGKKESVGVITDYVDADLTIFIKKVVETYCDIPWVDTKCGYACSDHASASKAGYPSAFVIESEFALSDKKIHTTDDKLEYLSFNHMLQHAKMTLGFAYELGMADFA